jgi:hypothetical protein
VTKYAPMSYSLWHIALIRALQPSDKTQSG